MQKVEWVIKPGNVERKRRGVKQPGLDLTRAVFDILKDDGMVVTNDCCTYYPAFPVLIVADHTAPTALEMTDVPIGGVFIAKESATSEVWYLWMKFNATTAFDIANND